LQSKNAIIGQGEARKLHSTKREGVHYKGKVVYVSATVCMLGALALSGLISPDAKCQTINVGPICTPFNPLNCLRGSYAFQFTGT
jgi:hypothetical protein